ncbi:Na/Pi cotransporter family protein [bacterium]|nr:Na/Pi cotransporter family protein [bacterium]
MNLQLFCGILGGLGLFIFGMRLLSDGLQSVASTRLRKIIILFTNKPMLGIISGCLLTAIIQSSSATTVLTIGFVNSGMMLLKQAIGVIIGANIGTTITAQIIAFKITKLALPAIGIGCAMHLFGRNKRTQLWGKVILGFGILFLGLTTMSSVLKPLKNSAVAKNFFINLGQHPLLGILTGTLVTFIVQSSSASIGLVIALASTGLIDIQAAIYLVLGDNIGTTITAWLASIGANLTARRVALAHSMFNLIGATYFAFLTSTGFFIHFVDWITPGPITPGTMARNIANAHSIFNIFNALLFMPFTGLLEKLVKFILPGKEEIIAEPCYLEKHLLDNPEIALSQTKKEMHRMLVLSKNAVDSAMDSFFKKDRKLLKEVSKLEDTIDNLQSEITLYIVDISKGSLTHEQSEQIPGLLHTVNDIERIGDHAENIMRIAERVIDKKMTIHDKGIERIKKINNDITEMFDILIMIIAEEKTISIKNVFKLETNLNERYKLTGKEQIKHLQQGKDQVLAGIALLDLINNMEKIGDHLTNIAQSLNKGFRYKQQSLIS